VHQLEEWLCKNKRPQVIGVNIACGNGAVREGQDASVKLRAENSLQVLVECLVDDVCV